MSEINLLPQASKSSGGVSKLQRYVKNGAVITGSVAGISVLVFFAAQIFFAYQLKNIEESKLAATTELQNLQNAEQKLVLIKDRLSKIDKIVKTDDASGEIEILSTVISNMPQDVTLAAATLGKSSALITINTQTSLGLTGFYSNLTSQNYSKINLKNFKYDQKRGYVVDVDIVK